MNWNRKQQMHSACQIQWLEFGGVMSAHQCTEELISYLPQGRNKHPTENIESHQVFDNVARI